MKKILFLITSLGGGGAERVLINLVNMLPRDKYEITVQTIFDIVVDRNALESHIRYKPGFFWQFPGNSRILRLIPRKLLYKAMVHEKYDVVVAFLEGPPTRIVSGCDNPDTELVTWLHVEHRTNKAVVKHYRSEKEAESVYNRFNRVICVAQTVKANLTALLTVKTPIDVLYNVNDTEKVTRMAAEPIDSSILSSDVNVVTVGRMVEQKGFDRLLRVHAQLLREGYSHHLYLLGTGKDEDALKKQAEKAGNADTVHFLGYQKNPYQYMSKCDMFVCSSRREGFSTAVTEALVLGLPIVSTDCSGAREMLGEDEFGIVTDNSEEGLLNGMRKMLASAELRRDYQKKSAMRGKNFAAASAVAAVESMLDSL